MVRRSEGGPGASRRSAMAAHGPLGPSDVAGVEGKATMRTALGALAAVVLLLGAACSSDDNGGDDGEVTTTVASDDAATNGNDATNDDDAEASGDESAGDESAGDGDLIAAYCDAVRDYNEWADEAEANPDDTDLASEATDRALEVAQLGASVSAELETFSAEDLERFEDCASDTDD